MALTSASDDKGAVAQLGMHSRKSRETFAISTCLLQSWHMESLLPKVNEALATVPGLDVRCDVGSFHGAIKRISMRQGFIAAHDALSAAARLASSAAEMTTSASSASSTRVKCGNVDAQLGLGLESAQQIASSQNEVGESVLLQLTTKSGMNHRERRAFIKVVEQLQENLVVAGIVHSEHSKRSTAAPADRSEVLHGQGHVFVALPGLAFKVSPASFLQVNNAQCAAMYSAIQQAADLRPEDSVLDLCCGAGTISVWLSRYCADVTGVDISKSAIDDARENAQLNGVHNARFYVRDLSRVSDIEACASLFAKADVVVVDPARAGLSAHALQMLAMSRARTIVYASCWAQSFCRDLRDLQRHGWECLSVVGIDMFPQTDHCETVAKLVQTGSECA